MADSRSMRTGAASAPRTDAFRDVPDRLWTPQEAARFLGVSTRTLRRLVYWQNLPCVRISSRLRFVPADVLAWARQR